MYEMFASLLASCISCLGSVLSNLPELQPLLLPLQAYVSQLKLEGLALSSDMLILKPIMVHAKSVVPQFVSAGCSVHLQPLAV